MNNVTLLGRLTKDVDLRYTGSDMAVARFNLAVDRRFKKDGEATADFISCVAFGKTAEFIEKWFQKGSSLAIVGHIQTGSYEKDGQRVYTTDVIVDQAFFTGSKGSGNNEAPSTPAGVTEVLSDEEIPF